MNHKAGALTTGRQLSHLKLPLLAPQIRPVRPVQKVKSGKLPTYLPRAQARPGAVSHLGTVKIKDEQSQVVKKGEQKEGSGLEGRFAAEIGEKMSNIIKKNQMLNEDYFNNGTLSFEEHVKKHREKLRERRQKQTQEKQIKSDSLRPTSKQLRTTLRAEDREHRKQNSSRQKNRQKVEPQDTKEIRNKKKGLSTDNLNNRLQRKMKELQQKIGRRTVERSGLATEGDEKSDNLFDSIHNYLANPHRLSLGQFHHNSSLGTLKTKRLNLQAKLKDLGERVPTPKQVTTSLERLPRGEWRRVDLGTAGKTTDIEVKESNFEGEVSHLGHLQQRNQESLQRYIQHQRMKIDLQLQKNTCQKQAQLRRQFYDQ